MPKNVTGAKGMPGAGATFSDEFFTMYGNEGYASMIKSDVMALARSMNAIKKDTTVPTRVEGRRPFARRTLVDRSTDAKAHNPLIMMKSADAEHQANTENPTVGTNQKNH